MTINLQGFNPKNLMCQCPRCKKKESVRLSDIVRNPHAVCDDCKKSKEYKKELSDKAKFLKKKIDESPNLSASYKATKTKDVTSFFETKDGKTVGMGLKGEFVKPSETRYDLEHDPHGWKSVYGRKAKVVR